MRKLIEELQTEIERRELKDIALEGLFLALQIVKSHDPWIDVGKELPPREAVNGTQARYSITVLGANSYEIIGAVFCYANEKTGIPDWYIIGQRDTVKVTKWTYLPEVKS